MFFSLVQCNQFFNCHLQSFVSGTGLLQELSPFVRFQLQNNIKQFVYFFPSLRIHHSCISCSNQALAFRHSRRIVREETFSTSAISSKSNPPKNFISTMRLLFESICARDVSASSSAINSAARSLDT